MLKDLRNLIVRMHRSEQGAEGLEKLLLLAALILPLLGVLVFYGEDLINWLSDKWSSMKGDNRIDGGGGY